MKKLIVIGLIGLFVMAGMFLQSPHNSKETEFKMMFTGSPDQYGNQILNVTVAQDVGGVWTERGTLTAEDYTGSNSILAVLNESTRFTVTVALNYSWISHPSEIEGFTEAYLTINNELELIPMAFLSVDLVTEEQGWIAVYYYVWDTEGKPEAVTYTVLIDYEAAGPSKNYNLTYYDASFDTTSTHWVDGTNTTDLDWTEYCNITSDGDILTITQGTSSETGFIGADDGLSIDHNAFPFFQFSVTEVTCNWRVVFYNGTTWTTLKDYSTETGVFTFNIAGLPATTNLLRFQSSNAVSGDYIKIDFYNFYALADYGIQDTENINQVAYVVQNSLTLTTTLTESWQIVDLTAGGELIGDSDLVFKLSGTAQYRFAIYDGSGLSYVNDYTTATATETEYSIDISSLSGKAIDRIYIFIQGVGTTSEYTLKYIYIQNYGAFNVSLENDGVSFSQYDNAYDTDYEGLGQFVGDFSTLTDYKPLHGLGATTIILWITPIEGEQDAVYVSQYVDDNNRIEIGYDAITFYNGNFTFTIGNGSSYERLEVPFSIHEGPQSFFCLVASWEKSGNLFLTVNGTTYTSDNTLNGVVSADDELYIGLRDGEGEGGPSTIYGLSYYYRNITDTEKEIIYSEGPDKTLTYLYQHYGFNEYAFGYGANSPLLHGGDHAISIRESWGFFVTGTDSDYIAFPHWYLYPEVYIWILGWVVMGGVPIYAIHQGRKPEKDWSDKIYYVFLVLIGISFGLVMLLSVGMI